MRKMQWALLAAVMTVAIGLWMVEARGEGATQMVPTSPVPRFTIQTDTNCVVDNLTGLMWARNANLPGATQTWAQAVAFCKNLNYGGHSDWRLPNLVELCGLMDMKYNRPALSNTDGTAKWKEGDPFNGVLEYVMYNSEHGNYAWYWVTTTTAGEPAGAWLSTFFNGSIARENDSETTGAGYVWPVRDVKSAPAPTRDAWYNFFSQPCLVKDGQLRADIVIAAKPTRAAKLAALELHTYIEKISGAKLPIVTTPGTDASTHIYVGKSEYTDRLNISDEGSKGGAFRMVSGKDYLVLLGHDKDFALSEYVAHYQVPAEVERAHKAWDAHTGEHFGNPMQSWGDYSYTTGIGERDERGTLNAVYEFLRGLGVRWYMPGDLGEIVPKLNTIALDSVNKIVKPDFPYRDLGAYSPSFGHGIREDVLYKLRTGYDSSVGLDAPHALGYVIGRAEVQKEHPEFYANHPDDHAVCLSSPEFLAFTVKYARTVFDTYPDLKYVSIWPGDGFYNDSMCQCDACKGKLTPKRGLEGELSDYVWDFVERVAKELYKTHPDRILVCGAYGAYALPPEKIAVFSPNVMAMLCLVQERESFNNPEVRAKALEVRKGWLAKLAPGNLSNSPHYLNSRSYLPSYFPHAIAEDLHSLKGLSQGEYIELTWGNYDGGRYSGMHAPGFNHLNVYVTSRYYWDADQDIEALLDEYYDKFYGPAAKEMKAFIEHCEKNGRFMTTKVEATDRALALLDAARKAAGDTVYGKRIDLVADYCQVSMTELRDRLSKDRKDVPRSRIFDPPANDSEITIDGRLDEPRWNNGNYAWNSYAYGMAELETGRRPVSGTSYRVIWGNRAIYFGIRCEEPDMKNLNITTTNNDDPAIFKGDCVDVLLETQSHSYYQIAVNPAGAVYDADMKGGTNLAWSSSAKVAVCKGDTFWSVEMRIPVGDMMGGGVDPTKSVEGRCPSALYPWAINVCRQRVSSTVTERSAWSPTGTNSFYVPLKFGTLSDTW